MIYYMPDRAISEWQHPTSLEISLSFGLDQIILEKKSDL